MMPVVWEELPYIGQLAVSHQSVVVSGCPVQPQWADRQHFLGGTKQESGQLCAPFQSEERDKMVEAD